MNKHILTDIVNALKMMTSDIWLLTVTAVKLLVSVVFWLSIFGLLIFTCHTWPIQCLEALGVLGIIGWFYLSYAQSCFEREQAELEQLDRIK